MFSRVYVVEFALGIAISVLRPAILRGRQKPPQVASRNLPDHYVRLDLICGNSETSSTADVEQNVHLRLKILKKHAISLYQSLPFFSYSTLGRMKYKDPETDKLGSCLIQ